MPYFWISAIQQGVFPAWVAQEAMGYPLFMNLQSGIFYPFFWLFVLFHFPYTLHAAVVMQCLHVLLGAGGMYYFMRAQGFSKPYALLAGIAYQFFGGFFSNAEHPDIIRGYALIPWLLAGLVEQNTFRLTLLIPVSVYLIFTGAYMGQALAMLWMSAGYVLFQTKKIYRYFLIGIGLLLSTIFILPVGLLKSEIAHKFLLGNESFFVAKNFFTTFLWTNSQLLPQDASMSSVFVTLPVIGMLFFLAPQHFKTNKANLFLLLLAIVMMTNNILYHVITHLISPLGLSRFPIADYRAYLAIMIIYFSVLALRDFREIKIHYIYLRLLFFVGMVLLGVHFLPPMDRVHLKIGLLAISLVGFLIFILRKPKIAWLFGLLIIFDGWRAWSKDEYMWIFPSNAMVYKSSPIEMTPIPSRPARRSGLINPAPSNDMSWAGYLGQGFLMNDYSGGQQLARQQAVQKDKAASEFMQQESRYRLTPAGDIKMKSYANNQIIYQININKSSVLLENEMYFPGWKAKLSNGTMLSAISAEPGLRAWHLPAGNYEMVTYFEMPYLKLATGISLLGLGIWIILIRRSYKVSRESNPLRLT